MDPKTVDKPRAIPDHVFRSVQRDDEILVSVSRQRGDGVHSYSWYLRAACDLIDCLELARYFVSLGADRLELRAARWIPRSSPSETGRYEYTSWTWRRVSQADRQTAALLENKLRRQREREEAAAGEKCKRCGHEAREHTGGANWGCTECACTGFVSGLVRVYR